MARSRRTLIRRLLTLGFVGGILAYRRQRLDAADRAYPQASKRA